MSRFKKSALSLTAAAALTIGGAAPAQAQDVVGSIQDTTGYIGHQLLTGGPNAWIAVFIGYPLAGSAVAGSLALKAMGICPPGDTSCANF